MSDKPRVAVEVHRVLCLVGHTRRSVLHPRDAGARIARALPVVIGDLFFRASPVELPQFIVRRIIQACLLGELLRVVLPTLARVLSNDQS